MMISRVPDITVELTPLGRWATRRALLEEGVEAPVTILTSAPLGGQITVA